MVVDQSSNYSPGGRVHDGVALIITQHPVFDKMESNEPSYIPSTQQLLD